MGVKHTNRRPRKDKRRTTRKQKGGSPTKYKTIMESLLSTKIPKAVIDFEISSFLKPEDNYTLRNTEIIDFAPSIRYEFEYDEDSHYMDDPFSNQHQMSGENYTLSNVRFDDATKKRIDACVIYDAKLSQIEDHGKVIDLKPEIVVTLVLSEFKVKGQSTRPPGKKDEIVINGKSKRNNHKVTVYTSVGNKVLTECKKIYAHEV